MKVKLLLIALLLVAFDAYGFYSCSRARLDTSMSTTTATKINQEIRCLNKETLEKDFNKIFEIAVRPEQKIVTIIRDRSKNTKEYKEKVYVEDKINNKQKSPHIVLVNSITARYGVFYSIAQIACENAFGDVEGWEYKGVSPYRPEFQEIKSQQIDNPVIKKRSGLLAKNNYTEYHYKIYDFESTYICTTQEEAQQENERIKQEKIAKVKKEEEEIKRKEEEKRLAELEKKKSLCREMGVKSSWVETFFKRESSEMVLCVTRLMEIDKMSEIAEGQKQQAIANRNRALNEMARVNEQIRKDEQSRRQSEALINLGAAISSGGNIASSPPASSRSTGYLKSQTVSGANRICYYNVMGSTKTLNVRASSTCPISYKF